MRLVCHDVSVATEGSYGVLRQLLACLIIGRGGALGRIDFGQAGEAILLPGSDTSMPQTHVVLEL